MKRSPIFKFLVVGILIGLVLTWQFTAKIPITSSFPTDEIEARQTLLNDFLEDQKYLQSRIVALRSQIEEAQTNVETTAEENNLDTLNELKKNLGLVEMVGNGIEIEMDDGRSAIRGGSNFTDTDLIQASDIRDVVNILNAAQASAISVNNHRVIATSTISSVGNTVLVNNSRVSPPFFINAVGDIETMIQRLLNKGLLPSIYLRQSKGNIVFKIRPKDFVTIPTYNGDLKADHLTLVK